MKTFYRVCAIGTRPLPQEFETADAACESAKAELKAFPNGVFEILKCVAMVHYVEASTVWMDGEGPAEKPRYRMLDVGEEVLPGDQYSSDGFAWYDVPGAGYAINESCATHRRPL